MKRIVMMMLLIALPLAAAQRGIAPAAVGANRLDVDATLLAGAAPLRYDHGEYAGGLDDLRIVDRTGREVPYLAIAPATAKSQWTSGQLLDVAPTKTTSGFEVDLGGARAIDRLRIEGIAAPFLKRARLEGSGDRAHWTLLAAEATVFDLPEQNLREEEIAFAPGAYRYLRVTWDDRASARVTRVGAASARLHANGAPPEPLRVAVSFRRIASEAGKSRYRVTLPGPHLPIEALEVVVASGNVFRNASVTEPRLANGIVAPVPLGASRLRRAERDGIVAAELAVPITFPDGPDLDLLIEDANNPPLNITELRARFAPLPWLYFEAPSTDALTARWGDAKRNEPTYDLEAKRDEAMHSTPPLAKWLGDAAASKDAQATPPLKLEGATLDRDSYRVARPIADAQPGLVSLPLPADVIADCRCVDQVRIVDASDRQVPYLIEQRDAPLVRDVQVPHALREGRASVYRLALPFEALPERAKLVLTTNARVFDRTVVLRRENQTLATATWRSTEPELAAPALVLEPPLNGRGFELVIDEGDNAPLPIAKAELLLPSVALRFLHPGGKLTLLYDNPESGPPRYDLALLAPRLFGQSARELGFATKRAEFTPRAPAGASARKWFWVAIVIAVAALLAMLARLVRVQQ